MQATAYILVRDGYDAMTTNQIAERAGVNIASLYQYFSSKESIVAALMQRHVDEMRAASVATWMQHREQTPSERIRALIEVAAATHAVSPKLHEVFTRIGPRLGFQKALNDTDSLIEAESRVWVEQMQGTLPDPALALWIVRTAVHAVMHLAFIERKDIATSPVLVDELVRLVTPFLVGETLPKRRAKARKKG